MNWKERIALDVVPDDAVPPRPQWHNAVPMCDERCPRHDGKRCDVLGLRPGALCEPVVQQMGFALAIHMAKETNP